LITVYTVQLTVQCLSLAAQNSCSAPDWNIWPNFGRYSERKFGFKMTFGRIRRVAPNFLLSYITNLESNLKIFRILERKWAICWREIQIFLVNSESPCHRFQSGQCIVQLFIFLALFSKGIPLEPVSEILSASQISSQ